MRLESEISLSRDYPDKSAILPDSCKILERLVEDYFIVLGIYFGDIL